MKASFFRRSRRPVTTLSLGAALVFGVSPVVGQVQPTDGCGGGITASIYCCPDPEPTFRSARRWQVIRRGCVPTVMVESCPTVCWSAEPQLSAHFESANTPQVHLDIANDRGRVTAGAPDGTRSILNLTEAPSNVAANPSLASPSDPASQGASPNQIQDPANEAAWESRLEQKASEVEELRTVVGQLKVELRTTTQRMYANQRAAKAKQERLQSEIQTLKAEVQSLRSSRDRIATEGQKASEFETEFRQRIAALEQDIAAKDQALSQTRQSLKSVQQELEKERMARKDAEATVAQQSKQHDRALAQVKQARQNAQKAQRQAEAMLEQVRQLRQPKRRDKEGTSDTQPNTRRPQPGGENPDVKADSNRRPQPANRQRPRKGDKADDRTSRPRKSDDPSRADDASGNLPGSRDFNAQQQIEKLNRSLDRQIQQVTQANRRDLEAELKKLRAEGLGEDHPRLRETIKASQEALKSRTESIRQRVEERIERVRREQARREIS